MMLAYDTEMIAWRFNSYPYFSGRTTDCGRR
jgi:hypothetical protein